MPPKHSNMNTSSMSSRQLEMSKTHSSTGTQGSTMSTISRQGERNSANCSTETDSMNNNGKFFNKGNSSSSFNFYRNNQGA